MSFDITELTSITMDSEWLEVCHPQTGAKMGVRINLASPDSSHYQAAVMKQQNAQMAFSRKNGGKLSAEQLRDNNLTLLVAATIGWDGIEEKKTEIPFSPDAARDLYKRFPWLREQVDEFLADRRNFFGSSATN